MMNAEQTAAYVAFLDLQYMARDAKKVSQSAYSDEPEDLRDLAYAWECIGKAMDKAAAATGKLMDIPEDELGSLVSETISPLIERLRARTNKEAEYRSECAAENAAYHRATGRDPARIDDRGEEYAQRFNGLPWGE